MQFKRDRLVHDVVFIPDGKFIQEKFKVEYLRIHIRKEYISNESIFSEWYNQSYMWWLVLKKMRTNGN